MLIEHRVSRLMSVDDALHPAGLRAGHIDHILPRHIKAAGIIGEAIDGVAREIEPAANQSSAASPRA